jgi:hypothetical protein
VEICFLCIRFFRILLLDKKFNDFYYNNYEIEKEINNTECISSVIYSLKVNKNYKIERHEILEKEKENIFNNSNFINQFENEKSEAFKEATRKGDFYFIYLFIFLLRLQK